MTEPFMENGYRIEVEARYMSQDKRWVARAVVVHPVGDSTGRRVGLSPPLSFRR